MQDGQETNYITATLGVYLSLYNVFQSLLALGCVDTVEPAIIPVLLGGGRPLLPSPATRHMLTLTSQRVYPSGIVWLEYTVQKPEESGA